MNCPHCETHIDEHEANRCLDAWVAEKVMGKDPGDYPLERIKELEYHICDMGDVLPHYSTSIADAWLVVEKFEAFDLSYLPGFGWKAWFWMDGGEKVVGNVGVSNTAPEAISLAALKATAND